MKVSKLQLRKQNFEVTESHLSQSISRSIHLETILLGEQQIDKHIFIMASSSTDPTPPSYEDLAAIEDEFDQIETEIRT